MDVTQIRKVENERLEQIEDIDVMIDKVFNVPTKAAAAKAGKAEDDTTDSEKVVLELKTIWPIVKAVFSFVRPFLIFKPKWKIIVDRFIAGIDVMIPE